MSSVIKPVITHSGRSVYPTLFDCVKSLFNRVDECLLSGGKEDSDSTSMSLGKELASTLFKEHEFLFQDIDLPIESVRSKFAQSVLAYVKVLKKSSSSLDSSQKCVIEKWKANERSESVKGVWHEILEQV